MTLARGARLSPTLRQPTPPCVTVCSVRVRVGRVRVRVRVPGRVRVRVRVCWIQSSADRPPADMAPSKQVLTAFSLVVIGLLVLVLYKLDMVSTRFPLQGGGPRGPAGPAGPAGGPSGWMKSAAWSPVPGESVDLDLDLDSPALMLVAGSYRSQ